MRHAVQLQYASDIIKAHIYAYLATQPGSGRQRSTALTASELWSLQLKLGTDAAFQNKRQARYGPNSPHVPDTGQSPLFLRYWRCCCFHGDVWKVVYPQALHTRSPGARLLLWKCIPESLHLYCCHIDKSIYTWKERSIPSSCWRVSQESSLDSAERNLLSGRHVQCPRDFPHSVFGSSCECLYFDCMFVGLFFFLKKSHDELFLLSNNQLKSL